MFYGRKNRFRHGKQNLNDGSKNGISLGVANQEVQSKGALFDRIMSLENQLTQLSMEIEYSKSSYASSSDASSSNGFKIAERVCSYPTFNNPVATYSLITRNPVQVDINKLKPQKESHKSQREMKHSTSVVRQHPKKNGERRRSSPEENPGSQLAGQVSDYWVAKFVCITSLSFCFGIAFFPNKCNFCIR